MQKRVFPVIHAVDKEQVVRNASIAKDAGASGVFVINHDMPVEEMLLLAFEAQLIIPWVGINCLGYSALNAMKTVPHYISGLWTDNAGIDETTDSQVYAKSVKAAKVDYLWRGEYFGGVAFKYQDPVTDLRAATTQASGYMDVITTSGPATGQAADVEKLRIMHGVFDGWVARPRIAVASGITPHNVGFFLPYVDDFLVATGISFDFHELDPNKVKALVKEVVSSSI
jgi:predicted TIM-barrel enzyme